jgi:hypothetical protein
VKKIHGFLMIVGLIALAMLFASCEGTHTFEDMHLAPDSRGRYYFHNYSSKDIRVTVSEGAGTVDGSYTSASLRGADPKKFTLGYDERILFYTNATTVIFTAKGNSQSIGMRRDSSSGGVIFYDE